MLLVLDNFEHLMPAATAVSELLRAAPHLHVLVTSCARLRLRNEQLYEIPALPLPPLGEPALPEVVSQYASVAMFTERARLVRPGFTLTDANAQSVAEPCYRLEGLPRAIELAAARLSIMPAQALLARLENRLGVLTGGARYLPTRQQTLRATLEWSYDLLSEAQKELFRTFSVFTGGCTLEAVEEVCARLAPMPCDNQPGGRTKPDFYSESDESVSALDAVSVVETLSALAENSLIRRAERAGGEVRFSMLATVREYL